jgi:hypothetical protein
MARMARPGHAEQMSRSSSTIRRRSAIVMTLGALLVAAMAWQGCAPTRSSVPPVSPQAAVVPLPEDGGFPVVPSTRKGIIVPSDIGFGAHSPGNAPSTGTSGGSAAERPLDSSRGAGN